MGLPLRLFFCVMACWLPLQAAEKDLHVSVSDEPKRIIYVMQSGQLQNALDLYREYVKHTGHHDYDVLQEIGLTLLEQGFRTDDAEIQLITLYGAGIAVNERLLNLLLEGVKSKNPEFQLIALNFLSLYHSNEADEALNKTLSSNFLIIRLEGAYHLCKKKAPKAVPQAEALMAKVDAELLPLFPQFFAAVGNDESVKVLRRLLIHPNELVRVATILSLAGSKRDDLLPQLRQLVSHLNVPQQEACAYALGILKDEQSISKLQRLSEKGSICVRLAAAQALHALGNERGKEVIEELAKKGDLFAISLLGDMPGSEQILFSFVKDPDVQKRLNAAIALIRLHDKRALDPLCEFLIEDSRDLLLTEVTSPGHALKAFKVIPSAQQNVANPAVESMSLGIREDMVKEALELPEDHYLALAGFIFKMRQNDLVPAVIEGLESLATPEAIALLKKHQQQVGAPLIRNYCNLALYKLKQEGPYFSNLTQWIAGQKETLLFRSLLDHQQEQMTTFKLTPSESSRLLVASFEALAHDDKGIDVILNAIQYGNPKNRYALAGLLIQTTQ